MVVNCINEKMIILKTVANRLSVNIKQSKPILDFYDQKGVLKNIDGSKDISDVTKDVIDILDHFVIDQLLAVYFK